ncbi:MAG: cation:proton antiporter [Pseudomonadota bacterium]
MSVDPISSLLLALAVVLVAAKIGGHLAVRVRQPAVLGELVAGILLGNASLVGVPWVETIRQIPAMEVLSGLGVIFLLFSVGLESTIGGMMSVGLSSFLVAFLGVVTPMALGWGAGVWLLPQHSNYVHLFIGATLCATSVGITARVFADLGKVQSKEARIVLGAAVIDDVMGLIVLTIVVGLVAAADRGTPFSASTATWTVAKSVVFLVGAIFLGRLGTKKVLTMAARMQGSAVLLGFSLAICLIFAYLASLVGMAPIVGAFAAGLVLAEIRFKELSDKQTHDLEELVQPLLAFLTPVFFILMGMKVNLRTFTDPPTVGLALVLTAAAVLGKQACSLGVVGRGVDRLAVGLGMIPRGEVGLIFANMGLALTVGGERIIDEATFSAIVIMVAVTTLVTPPLLKWRMK